MMDVNVEESTIEIKDKMMDVNVEESTVEIEPWVDYLELEIGPILKYMQYPSFDSDEENVGDESTDDLLGICSRTDEPRADSADKLLEKVVCDDDSDENTVDVSTDDILEEDKEKLDIGTQTDEELRANALIEKVVCGDDLDENTGTVSADNISEEELIKQSYSNENISVDHTVDHLEEDVDVNADDDNIYAIGGTCIDKNMRDKSNDDISEEYEKIDSNGKHCILDIDYNNDDDFTGTYVLDEKKLDDLYEDNQMHTGSCRDAVVEIVNAERNVGTLQDINIKTNKKAENLDVGGENDLENEKTYVIIEHEYQLDMASEIVEKIKAEDETYDNGNMYLDPDTHVYAPALVTRDKCIPETELYAEIHAEDTEESLDEKKMTGKKEFENPLIDSQNRSISSLDSEVSKDARDTLYHRELDRDSIVDDTEIHSWREELKIREGFGGKIPAKEDGDEINTSISDEDNNTSEPSETGYSEASTKYASDDYSESMEDTNDRKITTSLADAYKSDSVLSHNVSQRETLSRERNNVTSKKQKDLYLDQSGYAGNDREEFRQKKNDKETSRQDSTKESYKERYMDNGNGILQRSQIERNMTEETICGRRVVTPQKKIMSLNEQDAYYVERKSDSIEKVESTHYDMPKGRNILKTVYNTRYTQAKQLSFDRDTRFDKFDNDYERQSTFHDKGSQRNIGEKYYRPNESVRRNGHKPELQGKRQIENRDNYSTQKHHQLAEMTVRGDRQTKYIDTKQNEKPYAHMAGRFNYTNRQLRSQDALANRQQKNVRISRKTDGKTDGPLSLQDSYGAGMDPNDTSQSGHRAFSSASNHFSESSSSIANQIKGGISQSPSKQSSIVRQQSVTSDINGEQREEGIKFERLKNLQEDDLFAKVKEIVGHLEKLEDYHRGDGMRVQKMLGDMYWDYTPLREMVGDCMADCGYAVVSMKMLKTLNGIGIFKNDDVWFPTYYTYNTMWNFTDASNKLAQALADNDAVRLLTLNCGHKPYINAIHSKNVYYVMKASLSILHNIARNSGMKHLFDENKTSETIMPFLESEDEMLKILATLTIANIVDEEENKTLITDTGTINCIVSWMEKALNLARRRYKGFTPQELTEGLNRLAVNDSNKMKIIEEGALPLFLKMLQHDDVREQSSAARIIWTLSFDKDVRQKINEFPELVPTLGKLTESTNKSLQTNTMGALWVIRGDNDVSKETRPKSAKSKSHVFLSYSWSDKETVLMIRDRLRAEGYAIWIDVEKMGGSTLEGMAGAVENSAVVLICMSEKYKQSPNCRTEAEYTFQLRKDYIPIMMQKKYRPDGWLGIILGAKLYFDFSGKYPFDKTFQGLLKELRGRGKVTPGHTPGDDQTDTTGTITHSHSLSSHASITGTPTHQIHSNSPVLNMGQEELIKWLRNVKLTECIPAFLEFDGKLLMQLKVMREEAPEFFYQCLEKRLNMSLIEILKFTRALEELH